MHNKKEILNIDEKLENILRSEYPETEHVFKKLEKDKNLYNLSTNDLNKMWSGIKSLLRNIKSFCKLAVKENGIANKEREHNIVLEIYSSIIKIAMQLIKLDDIPDVLLDVITILNLRIPGINNKMVKDQVSSFLEECWKLKLVKDGSKIKNVLNYLARSSKLSQEHVIRLNGIKYAIYSLKSSEDIKNVMKLARESTVLEISEGRDLLIYLLTVEEYWIMGVYNNIRVALETADSNCVKIYAEIFISAWQNITANRKIIETCLENLVYHCLRAKRDIEGRQKLGENLLIFLEVFHLQKNNDVKRMICDQYFQFMWSYLEAPGSCVRCNTAEVFFVAYPMNVSNKLSKSNSRLKKNKYLSMQHNAITTLLKDSNEKVCAVSIKGAFHILMNFWSDVPSKIVNEWLNICLEYAKTCNNPEIRKHVFEGLKLLLRNPQSYSNLEEIGKKIVNSMYDSNVNVKSVVLDFFLEMETSANIYVANVVPLNLILECLEMNSQVEIIDSLYKLLWLRIFFQKEERKVIKEILNVGQVNFNLARKFFLNSKDIIGFENAFKLLNILLSTIMQAIEILPEKEVSESKKRKPEDHEKKRPSEIENPLESDFDINELSIQILMDASALLYLVNVEDFQKNSVNNLVKNLTCKIVETLHSILEKFEDSTLSESAIFFLSLIPKSSIDNFEEYLEKYKRQLWQQNTSDNTVLSILLLMIRWEKMDILLNLMPSLLSFDDNLPSKLEFFMQSETMNDVSEMEIQERMLESGLRILRIIVQKDFQCNVMQNYHKSMICMWEKLFFIEACVENRLMNNNASCLLAEDCLKTVFNHYLSLIPILHNSDDFRSEIHFSRILTWVQEKIMLHISDVTDPDELSMNILKCVLNSSLEMITEFKAPPKLCCEIIILYTKCLMHRCGIIFVNSALVTILALMKFNSEIYKNDESKLMKIAIPSFFVAVLVTLTKYPEEAVKEHTTDLKSLADLIKNIFPLLGQSFDLRLKYMAIIFNTATFCLSKDFKMLNNEQISSSDSFHRKFPFIVEAIITMILHVEGFQDLCLDILNKSYSKYNTVDQLSSVMIIQRLIKPRNKVAVKKRKRIKNIIYSIKEQNQKSTVGICFTPDCDKFISESKRVIIEEVLSSWNIS